MATLPNKPLDEELNKICTSAINAITERVTVAIENGQPVDISETLSDLSKLDITLHYKVSQQLSTELSNAINDPKTEPQLEKSYRQCQRQILTQAKVIYANIFLDIMKKLSSIQNAEIQKIDLSESLKQLSDVDAKDWILITEKLSTELKNAINDRKTVSKLQDGYRQCLSQIDSLPIPEKVANEYNQGIDSAIQQLIAEQWKRTSPKRSIGIETNGQNNIRIERIEALTHQLLSQKSSVEPGQTITYSQLQARKLLIRELTNTQGNKQTKQLINIVKYTASHYQQIQKGGQETTSTVNDPSNEAPAPTRNQFVIASKNNDLLTEAKSLVLSHCNPKRANNNP